MRNLLLLVVVLVMTSCAEVAEQIREPWRASWVRAGSVAKDPEMVARTAKEIGLNAVITWSRNKKFNAAFITACKAEGIESYLSFTIIPPKGDEELAKFIQVMTEEESARAAEIRADRSIDQGGYQGGGMPLPGQLGVHTGRFLCFRRPEVKEYLKKKVRDIFESNPDLTGIAFDYFGYANFRQCHCEYCRANPADPLEALVEIQNSLTAYARNLRPSIKVTGHVYPVFLPEPFYGCRLNWDTVGETVGWFFVPLREPEQVRKETSALVKKSGGDGKVPRLVPFIGYFDLNPKKRTPKPPERFRAELEAVRAAGCRDLMLHDLTDIANNPETRRALEDFLK